MVSRVSVCGRMHNDRNVSWLHDFGPVAKLHVVVVAVPEVSLVHREQKKENVGRARVTALR